MTPEEKEYYSLENCERRLKALNALSDEVFDYGHALYFKVQVKDLEDFHKVMVASYPQAPEDILRKLYFAMRNLEEEDRKEEVERAKRANGEEKAGWLEWLTLIAIIGAVGTVIWLLG